MSQPETKVFRRVEGRKLTADEWSAMIEDQDKGERSWGLLNAYLCEWCKEMFVSIDRDRGVTPFMMPCPNPIHGRPPSTTPDPSLSDRKAKRQIQDRTRYDGTFIRTDVPRMPDGRPLTARSCMYRLPKFITEAQAEYEFYRPSFEAYSAIPIGPVSDHLSNGGLSFRKIGTVIDELTGLEK